MRRRAFLLGLAAMAASARAQRATRGGAPSLEAAVDKIAADALKGRPLPGLSVAVARAGRALLAKGYGFADLEFKVPAAPETVYQIGSVSKQFTGRRRHETRRAGEGSVSTTRLRNSCPTTRLEATASSSAICFTKLRVSGSSSRSRASTRWSPARLRGIRARTSSTSSRASRSSSPPASAGPTATLTTRCSASSSRRRRG